MTKPTFERDSLIDLTSLALGSLADRLGRKKAVQIDCGIIIIGTVSSTATFDILLRQRLMLLEREQVIQVASVSAWYQVMIGRIVTGLGVGALSAVVPLYQSETAPKEIRGSLVSLCSRSHNMPFRSHCLA